MTTLPPTTEPQADQPEALTPTMRATGRRARFWIVIATVAAIVVVLGVMIAGVGATAGGTPLAADNPAPQGAQALARVLEDHGVQIVDADGYAAARDALGADSRDATLLLVDPGGILDEERMRSLRDAAASTVLVDPGFDALAALLPGVSAAGQPSGETPAAGCALPAAVRAGTVTSGGSSLRATGDGLQSCFADADGRSLLVRDPSTATTALAAGDILSNERIIAQGNAALALGLLGEHPRLVWYLPTPADAAGGAAPSPAELTPGWVTPVAVLLIAAAFAAALWRGRRFGPLVIEDLPVAVPARETMEGRARLYARSSARLRALDALRIGAIGRIASVLGLPRNAAVEEVADAAAERIGQHRDEVRRVLRDTEPSNDEELLALARRLDELEASVRRTVSLDPGQAAPPKPVDGDEITDLTPTEPHAVRKDEKP